MSFFFFNDTATTEIYTLSLHDALPILFFQDPLRGGLWRLADHQARGREHPSLAVRLGPLRIEGSHVVPRCRGVQVAHQDVFRMSRLADDEERRKAESTFRDLMRGHRSSHRVESAEFPLGGHGPRKFAGLFQPSCLGHPPRFHEGRSTASAAPLLPRTSCAPGTYARPPWPATCTSSARPGQASRRWCTPSSCG